MKAVHIDALNTTLRSFVENNLISAIAYGVCQLPARPLLSGVGVTRWDSDAGVTKETLFDVASLTKVLCTFPAIMQLVDRGEIDLGVSIGTYLPELPKTMRNPTVEQLLCHQGGLPAFISDEQLLQYNASNKEDILAALAIGPVNPPGITTQYSDIGYMLLGWLVEEVSQKRLDHYASDNIFSPLSMDHTFFNPPNTETVAATKFCLMRNKVLQGETQNNVSWALGGVAGHAGLFSTAGDVLRFGVTMLENPERIFSKKRLVQSLTDHGQGRGLGWMLAPVLPMAKYSWPQDSFGHTGYTGTSMIIVPSQSLVVVLLSNRTHLNMDNPAIQTLRQAFHDFILMS